MAALHVLSPADVDQFIAEGYVVLREAFPSKVAAQIRERIWQRMELNPNEPSSWKKPLIHLHESFKDAPFSDALTPRLFAGYDDVMGEGRYHRPSSLGWWPVSFPGFEPPPWTPPKTGWHVDGIQFHHHIYSKDQGLLPIYLLSDIGPGDGGTAVDAGLHIRNARILAAAEPAGLSPEALTTEVNKTLPVKPVEMTGNAGDVVLLHPFMLHARSANTGKTVRFICNPCVSLKEHMNLKRPNPDEYSPVERSIVNAIN